MSLDDLGTEVSPGRPVRRVVSLVPSLTEVIASVDPALLVGATQWCTHPADLDVVRVRGTKNPDVARILALAPDLVVANQEENRALDVHRLREADVPVWVTRIETLDEAFASMRRLVSEALGREVPAWISEAEAAWREPPPAGRGRVAVAVWRDPWMVVGRDTFTGDLVRRLGWEHTFAGADDRYPHVELADLDHTGLDLVLLPDEPYVFTADDGPESFTHVPTELVPGRLLTWYGPSLLEAHETLRW